MLLNIVFRHIYKIKHSFNVGVGVSEIADQKMLIFRSSDFFRYSERVSSNKSEGEKLKDRR